MGLNDNSHSEDTGAFVAEKPMARLSLLNELLKLWIFLIMPIRGCWSPLSRHRRCAEPVPSGDYRIIYRLTTRYDKYSSITNAVGTSAPRNIYEMRWARLPKLGVIGHFAHCNRIAIFNLRSLTVTAQL